MINLLNTLLSEFSERFESSQSNLIRQTQFSALPNKIKVAIGMRRVGKTCFILQIIRELIKTKKIPWQRFLYLNFEDDRLLPCSQTKFRELLEGFYKIYPENHDHTCYLFLDEVQNVEDWALVIRRFFDTKNVQIYLTGSSAKLLSKEIASSLRGRSIAIEIWPYSFNEYLTAHQVKWKKGLFSQKTQDTLHYHLREYLSQGGFPETVSASPTERRQILQDYVELVVSRDLIERHNITNITLLKYLIKTLLSNVGGNFSVNKFANDIKSQGISGAKNTIYDYLTYIEDAYLVFPVALYSRSIRQTQTNPRKIYAVDPGLVKAFSLGFSKNYGHLFENIVFLDLKRLGHKIYYYLTQDRLEIDFLTEDKMGNIHLYQVAWDTSDPKTLAREQKALKQAIAELKVPGTLITPEYYIEFGVA